jgi:hypothetical protein
MRTPQGFDRPARQRFLPRGAAPHNADPCAAGIIPPHRQFPTEPPTDPNRPASSQITGGCEPLRGSTAQRDSASSQGAQPPTMRIPAQQG